MTDAQKQHVTDAFNLASELVFKNHDISKEDPRIFLEVFHAALQEESPPSPFLQWPPAGAPSTTIDLGSIK